MLMGVFRTVFDMLSRFSFEYVQIVLQFALILTGGAITLMFAQMVYFSVASFSSIKLVTPILKILKH